MKKITLSIVFTVTASLFLFGWLLDFIVDQSATNEHVSTDLLAQKMVNGAIATLNTTEQDAIYLAVATFNQQFDLNLAIEMAADYPLDEALMKELYSNTGLILADQNGPYLLKPIEQHPQYLLKFPIFAELDDTSSFDFVLTLALYASISLVLVAWMFPLIRRLSLLTKTATKFGKGELHARIPISRYSYITQLEESFNKMAGQIESLLEENKLLASSLSHDLRTPLACFRFGLDACMHESDLTRKDRYLARMEKDLVNMENMLNAFLDFASMERQRLNLVFETLSLTQLVSSVASDMQSLANKKSKTLLTFSSSEIEVKGDKVWLYRAITNLLANAVEYSNTQVAMVLLKSQVDSSKHVKPINLYIVDDGKGIPPSQKAIIFDAFVKLDSSRTQVGRHFGLGLAIVKRVADWHEFSVVSGNRGDFPEIDNLVPNEFQGAVFKLSCC